MSTSGSPTDSPVKHRIHVDGVPFTVTQTSLSGAQIKALVNKDAQYQLFQEVPGDGEDKLIGDNASVAITDNTLHFYTVPSASFGAR